MKDCFPINGEKLRFSIVSSLYNYALLHFNPHKPTMFVNNQVTKVLYSLFL